MAKDILIQNVPEKLLTEFDNIVVKHFSGGRNEAFRDLMRKAICSYKTVASNVKPQEFGECSCCGRKSVVLVDGFLCGKCYVEHGKEA